MSSDKLRSINTKFWDDPYVEGLQSSDRLLFVYLLTNPHTSIAGMYELTVRKIVYHTGLTEKQVRDGLHLLKKDRKVFFFEDISFVFLPNFLKNQRFNANMLKSVLNTMNSLPEEVKDCIFGEPSKVFDDPYEGAAEAIRYLAANGSTKKAEARQQPKGKPEAGPAKKEPGLHERMKQLFLDHYQQQKNTPYYWTAKDGSALKQLIGKIEFSIKGSGSEPSEESVYETMAVLLNKNRDPWVTDNLSMTNLNSKYNEIVAKIKSGTTKGDRIGQDYRSSVLNRLLSREGADQP